MALMFWMAFKCMRVQWDRRIAVAMSMYEKLANRWMTASVYTFISELANNYLGTERAIYQLHLKHKLCRNESPSV